MSRRTRWLVVIASGLMVHLFLALYSLARLSPFYNLPDFTVGLPPFGQVNYDTADTIVVIELVIVFVLWVFFAVFLLRDSSDKD